MSADFSMQPATSKARNLNIAILGTSGSGKTSFFTGLYTALYQSTINGFGISPQVNDSNDLVSAYIYEGKFTELSFEKNGMNFPPSTADLQPTHWRFGLTHNLAIDDLPVCTITCLDYRGGLISHDTGGTSADNVNELLAHVSCSEAIIVFVDALALTKFHDIREIRRRSGIDYVMSIIRLITNRVRVPRMTLLVAMTKVDAVSEEWKVDRYAPLYEIGQQAAREMFTLAKTKNWVCGIVPVSVVGEGNASTTYVEPIDISSPYLTRIKLTGEPNPLNVGEALLFCIYTILQRHKAKDDREIEQRKGMAEYYLRQGIAQEIWARLRGKTTPAEEAQRIMDEADAAVVELRRYERYLLSLSQAGSPVKHCQTP